MRAPPVALLAAGSPCRSKFLTQMTERATLTPILSSTAPKTYRKMADAIVPNAVSPTNHWFTKTKTAAAKLIAAMVSCVALGQKTTLVTRAMLGK